MTMFCESLASQAGHGLLCIVIWISESLAFQARHVTNQPFAFHSFLERDAERVTRGQLPQHYKNEHRTFSCETVRPPNLARKSPASSVSSIVAIHTAVHLQSMIIWSTFVLDFLRLHASIHSLGIMVLAFNCVLMAVIARFGVVAFVFVPVMGLLGTINFVLTHVLLCIFLSRHFFFHSLPSICCAM